MNDSRALKSILFIAANPKGTISLRLQEEEREIKERLRLAGYGKVPINSTGATRPRDIQQSMLDFKPQIVHFSGHGVGQDGLVLEDINGQEKLVGSEALANLFKLFSNYVECTILNACYSKFQAEAISQYVDYVIGMSKSIGDRAAIEFSTGFYTALGAGESIEFAYELGCNLIQLEGISEHLTPVLFKKGELLTHSFLSDSTDCNISNLASHTSTAGNFIASRGDTLNEVGYKSKILHLLVNAQSESCSRSAYRLLSEALKLCKEWRSASDEAVILNAHVLKELAYEENTAIARTKRWKEAFEILENKLSKNQASNHSLANTYGVIAVRFFQDKYSNFSHDECRKYLVKAKGFLDRTITNAESSSVKALLLTRKSSILRQLANLEVSDRAKVAKLSEGIRCAELALSLSRDGNTLLELGLATWAVARYQSSDEKYTSELRKAENYLSDELLEPLEEAKRTKSLFYRMNYRSLEACETFPCSSEQIKRTRRMLQSASVYAEAAITLWYAKYPEAVYEPHLFESKNLLETAISSGYLTARNVINVAFIQAILGDISSAETVLSEICGNQRHISWNRAIELVTHADSTDPLSFGFALGIEDGSTLSKLGTFAITFLKDENLAESLYRAAVRSASHNAIVLTNLARFLVHYRANDNTSIKEAERLLQKAQNFADRRFKWWRIVLSELNLAKGKAVETVEVKPNPKTHTALENCIDVSNLSFVNLKALKECFSRVEKLSDSQQKGYQLEQLVYKLSQLTFGTAAPPYRIERAHGGISQIDGYFEHKSDKYRVECKWLSKPADHNDIVIFNDKLDVIGISGFFVSMSGFSEAAIGRARELKKEKAILLVDGEEIRKVFLGDLNFDELISLKRKHLDMRSNPYFRTCESLSVD